MTSDNSAPDNFHRQKITMLKAVQDALATQDFETEEEASAFLEKNFTGRHMDDIIGDFGDTTHSDTPRSRAEAKLDLIDPYSTNATNRRHALAATKIDPSCIEAWHTLAETYDSPAKAKAAYQKAINLGKKEFASLIEDSLQVAAKNDPEEKSWLWGHVEARPFLMAYEGLAELLISQEKLDQGIATYEETLRLNGNDNQGIRYKLLNYYILLSMEEKTENLLAEYPNDCAAEWLYQKALHTFQKITYRMEQEGTWEFEAPEDPATVNDLILLPQLPEECAIANSILAQAIESNALTPLFLCDTRCANFSTSDSYTVGGADEAFTISQAASLPWILDPLALLWLQESCFGPLHRDAVLKALGEHHAHVDDLDELLDQVPLDSIKEPELSQPSRAVSHLRKLLLEQHTPEDDNIVFIDQ